MNIYHSAPIDVLLVDDSPEDVRLTREALKGSRFRIHLKVATNGEEALAVLRHQGRHANAAQPNLILLDLNMPGMDGFEMLAVMKQDDALKSIPVVILTTSDSESDVLRTYQLQANAYVTKPARVDQFESTMKAIENFWMGIAKLPIRGCNTD